MCGIGGIYRMGDKPIMVWQLQVLMNGLQYRGNDATGVAIINYDGTTGYCKNNTPAWNFTASDGFNSWAKQHDWKNVRIALVHTRKATQGTPYKNKNNHPLQMGQSLVVHNGMIFNDGEIFKNQKWERSAETDSDAIRAILDDHGRIDADVIPKMNLLKGYAAVAAIHPASPDKLLLLRDNNPVMIGATDDFFAFASEKKVLHQILKPWGKKYNILLQKHSPDLWFVPMANESGWIVGPEGVEYHAKFTANGSGRGNTVYRDTMTDYHERQDRFRRQAQEADETETTPSSTETPASGGEALLKGEQVTSSVDNMPDFVICPNSTCNSHVGLSEIQKRTRTLDLLKCKACGTPLEGALRACVN